MHTVPLVAGMGFAIYALAMLAVRLSGIDCSVRFAATICFRSSPLRNARFGRWCLPSDRSRECVGRFGIARAGNRKRRPNDPQGGRSVGNVNTGGRSPRGRVWLGGMNGPGQMAPIASSTTLHTALFLIQSSLAPWQRVRGPARGCAPALFPAGAESTATDPVIKSVETRTSQVDRTGPAPFQGA